MQYEEFCRENSYPDGIVREERVLRLIDGVPKRGNPARPRGDGDNFGYNYYNLDQSLSAMVDLHEKQRNDPKNPHLDMNPVLRDPAIKQLEKRLETECRTTNTNDSEDRGENTIQDGYTFEQMLLMSQNHLNAENHIGYNLRDCMTLLLNHMMMLRGEVSEFIDLKRCFSLEFKDEGPTRCSVFVMKIVNGNKNQDPKNLYSGAIRHKEVNACDFGALDFYLFQRFHDDGQDCKSSIAPSTEIYAVYRASELAGVKSKELSHTGRGSGASDVEMAGASVDRIKRIER
ncbi:hypothetical protein [Parasitella parasitica]|uniref:Ndc10 domain-containing protein n=1 Tax=Parasitella parasitica TaxID=35722 RepID=A0A0B7NF40_9FUNG|nr:hypothetical protein [Parasitella parasitica]